MAYHELVKGKVFIGGVDDIQQAVTEQQITDVFDLRDKGTEPEGFPKVAARHHYPIVEDQEGQDSSVETAIRAIKGAVDNQKRVYFHCSGGRNRTGTVAAGLLIELGMAASVNEAEEAAKSVRPEISVKPEMKAVLNKLYPSKS